MDTLKMAIIMAGVGGITLLVAVVTVLVFPIGGPSSGVPMTPTIEIRIVGGEIGGQLAFGLEGQAITSPGPTIKVKVGDVVKVDFTNEGRVLHSFAVIRELREDAPSLFGAAIGSATRPLPPSREGSVTFRADRVGDFFYICTVPGHLRLGMYGEFLVEG